MDVKPGYASTEWWTTLAAHVIAVLALFHVAANSSNLAQALVGLAAAIGPELGAAFYAHSRARVKIAAVSALSPSPLPPASTATDSTASAAPVPPPIPAAAPSAPVAA